MADRRFKVVIHIAVLTRKAWNGVGSGRSRQWREGVLRLGNPGRFSRRDGKLPKGLGRAGEAAWGLRGTRVSSQISTLLGMAAHTHNPVPGR